MTDALPLLRLRAQPQGDRRVQLLVEWASPTEQTGGTCAPATLDPGTGTRIDLGVLCAPTPVTWREHRTMDLGTYEYPEGDTFVALLRWGEHPIRTEVRPGLPSKPEPRPLPHVSLLDTLVDEDDPTRVHVRVTVQNLAAGQRVRLDGGAGQIYLLIGEGLPEQSAEWTLTYPKGGTYTIALDALDAQGFFLGTLKEVPFTLELSTEPTPEEGETEAPALSPLARVALEETRLARAHRPAWLPFRYARPMWYGVRTYVAPGGGRVSRIVGLGTYFSIRAETLVNGHVWYKTAGNDWVPASSVVLLHPSDLRGVKLGSTAPPPPPPPPPPPSETPKHHGIVTAYVLNVRARPGVRPDNPPIDRLRRGTRVAIYEDTTYNGEVWYRIGTNRWVHSGWVRIVDGTSEQPLREGIVTAYILNVRARPGVRPDNPPIDRLRRGAHVTIYEDTVYNGEVWYRIGIHRWVHGAWVRVIRPRTAPREGTGEEPAEAARETLWQLPVGWIVAPVLNVRARPGVYRDNPPVDQVHYKDRFHILEERIVQGAPWYRIGEDRWVYGGWVGVARFKPRPALIRPDEYWVGVSLREQTLVAYEGDRPVYAALVATGLPQTPTVQGIFRTWLRLKWGKMSGGSYATGGYYYLEDVTWTMYFYRGYSLHTAYWHDAFGRPRSHGCVNMSPYDAWWVFQWSAAGGDHSPAVYVYWA